MRPLYLKIEGIKSVADEQTIDFERVAKNGIFGIFGKTGSGKSTILDSIVLALYGEIISNVDNSDFINNSRTKAKVELTFNILTGGLNKKYRVEREYKFTGKNKTLSSSAKLWEITEGGIYCVAEGSKLVTERIKDEIVGLSKAEFLKCIALPQGEFSSFIKMTRNERLLIIGKLFDLEKYGVKLYRNFKRQEEEYADEANRLIGEQTALEKYSTEMVETLKKELEENTAEYTNLLSKLNEQSEKCKKLNYAKKLIEERNQKNEEKIKKLSYKRDIDTFIKEIEQFDSIKALENEIRLFEENGKKISNEKELIAKFKLKKAELALKEEKLLKEKQLIPLKQEQILNANLTLQKLEEIKVKNDKLKESKKLLSELRDKYSNIELKIKNNLKEIENAQAEAEKNSTIAKNCDIESCLSQLVSKVSNNLLASYAKERIEFLNKLSSMIDDKIADNSELTSLILAENNKMIELINSSVSVDLRELLSSTLKVIEQNSSYLEQAQKSLAIVKNLTAQNQDLQLQLTEVKDQGSKERANFDKLNEEISSVLMGKTIEEVTLTTKKIIGDLTNEINLINTDNEAIAKLISENLVEIATHEATFSSLEESYNQAKITLNKTLEGTKLTIDECNSILENASAIEKNRQLVKEHETSILLIEKRLGELNEQLKNNEYSLFDIENQNQTLVKLQENCQNLAKKCGEINNNYQNSLKNNERWCIINNNLLENSAKRKQIGKMLELVKENRFMEYIAEEYLKDIASIAEERVLTLTSGRYGLQYKNGAFYVLDNLNGGKLRPAIGLSGGETFLVSLSLALALSSQISSKALRPLDFFFLDEGFGTLDDDLIDAVTDSLEKLQKANLTVGLITHVGELKNRIQSRIEVTGATALHGTLIKDNC